MDHPGAAVPAAAKAPEPLVPWHSPPPPPCCGVPVPDYQAPAVHPYLLVPLHPGGRRPHRRALFTFCVLALLAAALLLGAAGFFLWPSVPDARLAHLDLRYIGVYTNRHGGVALDLDMGLKVRVHNPNLFSLRYDAVALEVGYRGRPLGSVDVGGARLTARGESRVGARLRLERVWVLQDTAFLVDDIARGRIPLDAVTRVKGRFRLFGLGILMQGRISCAINVDMENQIIASQDCYPEPRE